MPSKLFAYGTLRQEAAPAEIAHAVARLRRVGSGVARGRLFDLGAYPGAVFAVSEPKTAGVQGATTETDMGCSDIIGEVYEVPDAELWAELDAYEGFQPGDASASLFLRREIDVWMIDTGERAVCWVYEYNGAADVSVRLEAGTSPGWAAETRQII
jgi:gamma-glutamylcyclotransferase (GGCT)/AIG2-like uncharacterized protein YtfP